MAINGAIQWCSSREECLIVWWTHEVDCVFWVVTRKFRKKVANQTLATTALKTMKLACPERLADSRIIFVTNDGDWGVCRVYFSIEHEHTYTWILYDTNHHSLRLDKNDILMLMLISLFPMEVWCMSWMYTITFYILIGYQLPPSPTEMSSHNALYDIHGSLFAQIILFVSDVWKAHEQWCTEMMPLWWFDHSSSLFFGGIYGNGLTTASLYSRRLFSTWFPLSLHCDGTYCALSL